MLQKKKIPGQKEGGGGAAPPGPIPKPALE